MLLSLRDRGVKAAKLAVGDGGLGYWSALAEVYPETRAQRCRVHKTVNVLDKLPKRLQGSAKSMLHEIWRADTRARAEKAFERFLATWEAKYPGPPTAWPGIGRRFWPSTTSRRLTGSICAPPTPSSRPSPPLGCERRRPGTA